MSWSATATISQPSGGTPTNLFSLLVNSSMPAGLTPPHSLLLQNGSASASLRYGDAAGVQTANGPTLAPGESIQLDVPSGVQIGVVGDGAAAVSAVNVLMIGG